MKSQKRKRHPGLPYWPTAKFLADSMNLAKEKGFKGDDEELKSLITKAYQLKRKELIEDMTIHKAK